MTSEVALAINANGTGTFTVGPHSGGATGATDHFTYNVNTDCSISVTDPSTNSSDFGVVARDGSMFVLVDADHFDNDTEIVFLVGIGKSTNPGNSVFSGNYWLAQAGEDRSAPGSLYTAPVDANSLGNGNASAAVSFHSMGNTRGSFPLMYQVHPDGTYFVNDGTSTDFGTITSNGDLLFVVDAVHATDSDSEIIFGAALRK